MNETERRIASSEELDSLSPYEVAILAFTSPQAVASRGEDSESIVTITSKESYVWAAAIAHALVQNEDLTPDDVLLALEESIRRVVTIASDYFMGFDLHTNPQLIGDFVISEFIDQLDVSRDVSEIKNQAENAIRSLVWRGYIEDPFNKKIATAMLAVLMVMPVGFTSDGDGSFRLNSLTWEYAQQPGGNQPRRKMHVKIVEIATAVLDKIVPAFINSVKKLSDDNGKIPPPQNIQKALKVKGYYHGAIDGKIGPSTANALRRFQSDYSLQQTGYPDQATVSALGIY